MQNGTSMSLLSNIFSRRGSFEHCRIVEREEKQELFKPGFPVLWLQRLENSILQV